VAAVFGAVRLLLDPSRLNDVFVIDRGITSSATRARIVARLRADETTARALEQRRRLPRIDLEALHALPSGTLGRTFADAMIARGLDPSAIPHLDATDDGTFVHAHLYETHDIWHAATGFGTDVAGELGLQAFYSAQLDGALPRILLIGGLINARFKGDDDWAPRLDAIARGWQMGNRARPLFGVAWDELWARTIDEVRAELGIEEFPRAREARGVHNAPDAVPAPLARAAHSSPGV
jgi:ubiquinone biosynthesis protein Coq4